MRRLLGPILVAALAATGCSSTDDSADTTADVTTGDDTTGDDTTGDDTTGDDPTGDDTTGDDPTSDDADTDPAGGDRAMITSFEDVPQECLDVTAEFLRAIEPIVSPIDWENGTLSDFESIAEAFETEAAAFDLRSADVCASIDLADDGLSVMIDFAQDEAPGTVGFLTFLDQLQNASLGGQPSLDDEPPAFDDCDGAIEFLEALLSAHETIVDVPLEDMVQVSNIGNVFMSCTPEQQAYLESPEVNAFFGE